MGVNIDVNGFGEGGERTVETEVIPDGFQLCRLVSYIEMGHHFPIFKGKHQTFETGKNAGKERPAEMIIHLCFEFTLAEHTGDFPLTVRTSVPFGDRGEFINKLSISPGVEEGWISKTNAMKSNFVKSLIAMQDACKASYGCMADFVGSVFGCTIVHTIGKKAREDGSLPRYANMALTSLVAPQFVNPVTKQVTVLELPEQEGEYCPVFYWDAPTIEAWTEVPEYLKKAILRAEDYPGSPLEMLLAGYKEETPKQEPEDTHDHSAPVEPATEVFLDDIPY